MYFNKFIVTFLLLALSSLNNTFSAVAESRSWENIFEEAKKSVVQIFTYHGSYDIFRPYKVPSHQLGCGTGFFINNDGYLLTNYHVVSNSLVSFMQLTQTGKEQFRLEIVGVHPDRDLALLKLPESELIRLKELLQVNTLPYLPFATDSDLVKEAEHIMLAGYPLGQENIKSSRGDCSGREYDPTRGNMIQTTVPTNHGNSGGPYLNNRGEIIGVCVAKIDSEEVDNVAYFIPINTVQITLPDLYKKKTVSGPFWGLSLIATTEHTHKALGCSQPGGIYVTKVHAGSLAESCGLQKGDLIYQINDLSIDHYGNIQLPGETYKMELGDYLSRQPLGTEGFLKVYRAGKELTLSFTTKEAEEFKVNTFYPYLDKPLECEVIGGFVMVELTYNHLDALKRKVPSVNKYLKPKHRLKGHVIISDIIPSSPGFKSKAITSGDWFISRINDQPIETLDDVRKAIESGKNREFITIETDAGALVFLSIDEVIKTEPVLAQQYGYPLSSLIGILADHR